MAKILLCCENYAPSIGGVQEVMRQIAERTAAAGHQVTVATTGHPHRDDDCEINGVRVKSFRMGGNIAKGLTGDVESYRKFLLDEAHDAILIKAAQQCTFDAALDVIEEVEAWKVFIPCGFSGLGSADYESYYRAMPGYLARFDKLIFYANAYRDIDLARKSGLSNWEIIPNGVDETEFFPVATRAAPGGSQDRESVILTVGNRIVSKGHWEVLDAFAKIRANRPLRLILNGNSPRRSLARSLAGMLRDAFRGYYPLRARVLLSNLVFRLRGETKVVVVADLARRDLIDMYRCADLFLFASHIEYSPLVLFEAAASGTAFITTDVGNAREIAEWTGAGLVVTPPTPVVGRRAVRTRLAGAAERLLADPVKLQEMGETGRAAVEAYYCWGSIVRKYWRAMRIEPDPMLASGVTPTTRATAFETRGENR